MEAELPNLPGEVDSNFQRTGCNTHLDTPAHDKVEKHNHIASHLGNLNLADSLLPVIALFQMGSNDHHHAPQHILHCPFH